MTTVYFSDLDVSVVDRVLNRLPSPAPWARDVQDAIYPNWVGPLDSTLAPGVKVILKRLMRELATISAAPVRPDRYAKIGVPHYAEGMSMLDWLRGATFKQEAGDTTHAWWDATYQPVYAKKSEVASVLEGIHPHLLFRLAPNYDRMYARYSINPEAVAEADRRFLADFPETEVNLGWDNYITRSFRMEDGELSCTPENSSNFSVVALNVVDIPTVEAIPAMVEQARSAYRSRVMARIRSRSSFETEEREREQQIALHRAKTEQNFIRYRDSIQPKTDTSVEWIRTLPFVPNGVRASRNWGIEIETGAAGAVRRTPPGWDAKDDGSLEPTEGYAGSVWRYVDAEECYYSNSHDIEAQTETFYRENEYGEEREETRISDDYRDPQDCDDCGWIENESEYDDSCVEYVSPILSSMHSRGLKELCDDLEHTGYNESAGVHVHVDAADLTVAHIRELVLGYDHIEWLVESSYNRNERGYCKRRAPRELMEVARSAARVTEKRDIRKGDRYVTVNLQALDHHGTVEFRAMGPVYNYDLLTRWALFCREMVTSVKNGAKSKDFAKVKSWADVEKIFAKFGVEYNFATEQVQPEIMSEGQDFLVSV